MAISTGRVSLAFLAPRNQFACLKKQLKPTRVCFSDFGPSPKSSLTTSSGWQTNIVPPLASSSSLNRIFARRLTKPVSTSRATNAENSIPQAEDDKPTSRWFPMIYCCVGFTFLIALIDLPLCFGIHFVVRMLLDSTRFLFPSIHSNRQLRTFHRLGLMISSAGFFFASLA